MTAAAIAYQREGVGWCCRCYCRRRRKQHPTLLPSHPATASTSCSRRSRGSGRGPIPPDGNLVAAGLRDDPVSGALPWPPPRSQLDRSLVRVGAAKRWSWPCRAESADAINSLCALRWGDCCLFYHSGAGATSCHIVGVVEVAREWYEGEGEAASGGTVDVRAVGEFRLLVALGEIR
uniref:EVE domain-containing protein n=1 Tax=Oryza nivara TaxID=4536 RepID=A0A0E0IDI5_ORYNI